MKTKDARSYSREAMAERRRLAIRMLDDGMSREDVSRLIGVHVGTIGHWVRAHAQRGAGFFEASAEKGGRSRKTTVEDEQWLAHVVLTKTPQDYGFTSPLWSIAIARAVLLSERGIGISRAGMSRVLRRCGLRSRVPKKQATQRDDDEIERFREETAELLKTEQEAGNTILFMDEAGFRADSPVGTTWAMKNTRPVVRATGQRPRVSAVSAVSLEGELYWETYTGSFNAQRFCAFLWSLMEVFPGNFVLVLDRLRVHHCKEVTEWIAEHAATRIRLHPLPAYAPELNPAEYIWGAAKAEFRRHPLQVGEHIGELVDQRLDGLASDPQRVRRLLQHPDLAYLHTHEKRPAA